jgi:hypothetical protein
LDLEKSLFLEFKEGARRGALRAIEEISEAPRRHPESTIIAAVVDAYQLDQSRSAQT